MTVEHLQVLLDHSKDAKQLYQVAELLSRAEVPVSVRDAVRLGRLTALQKPDGGVRGMVAGNIVRRLVARTMYQQLMKDVERATAPFQYALTTRAGCKCIAHVGHSNHVSIDGISAYDLIPRSAMTECMKQRYISSPCSLGRHPHICGKTMREPPTRLRRVKEENRGVP